MRNMTVAAGFLLAVIVKNRGHSGLMSESLLHPISRRAPIFYISLT